MIIGFGGRLGSGKTVLSRQLVNLGFKKISFADYLKNLISAVYDMDPELLKSQESKAEILAQPLEWNYKIAEKLFKEAELHDYNLPVYDKLFKTRRELIQYIGTDVLRSYDNDFHVKKTVERLYDSVSYVCDDFRFKNEVHALKQKGARSIFIIRPDNLNYSNHDSEVSIKWTDCDYQIINDKSEQDFINNFLSSLNLETQSINIDNSTFNYNRYCFTYPSIEDSYFAGMFQACAELNSKNFKIKKLKQDFQLKLINFLNIKNNNLYFPYLIENLKHWNFSNNKNSNIIPDIIKKYDQMILSWLSGLVDATINSYHINDLVISGDNNIVSKIHLKYNCGTLNYNNDNCNLTFNDKDLLFLQNSLPANKYSVKYSESI